MTDQATCWHCCYAQENPDIYWCHEHDTVPRLTALTALIRQMRDLLGWECPRGRENELEAIDAEFARLGLSRFTTGDPNG